MKKTTKKQATRKSDAKKSTRKELRQVGRSKTFDEIIEKIRENVTSGKWRPGDKLPSERVLCEELGVSRPAMREALRALETIGLVRCNHGEGNYLAQDTSSCLIEPLSIMFSIGGANIAQVQHLRHALERETAEAVHVRRGRSARLLEAAELLQNRRMEAARSCMDSIPAICPPPKRYCAHPVADALLSEKLALCRGESITADCQVQIPAELQIPGAELCAVLGNLMDNAIEACRRLPEGTPHRITARGRVNGGFLVLRVQNPVSGEENNIPVGGALLDHHGWGLSIVRQIAERRGGRLTTERSDGQFISTVWLGAAE